MEMERVSITLGLEKCLLTPFLKKELLSFLRHVVQEDCSDRLLCHMEDRHHCFHNIEQSLGNSTTG